MDTDTVLVVATDAAIGALLGVLVERAGHRVTYPRDDEHPLRAIARVRPKLLLLDCDDTFAYVEETYARTRALGCAVLLFTHSRTEDEVLELATRHGVRAIALPLEFQSFRAMITDLVSAPQHGHPDAPALGQPARAHS